MIRSRAILLGVLGAAIALQAMADAGSEPDPALLEFLGSWGGEDKEWEEFFDSLPPAAIDPPEVAEAETDED